MPSFQEDLDELLHEIRSADALGQADHRVASGHASWLSGLSAGERNELIAAVCDLASEDPACYRWVPAVLIHLVRRDPDGDDELAASVPQLETLLKNWPDDVEGRGRALALLAASESAEALGAMANLLAEHPPQDAGEVAVALAPLLRQEPYDPAPLLPRLLDALQHPSTAAAVLDLCNFLRREGRVSSHPAQPRTAELIQLLRSLTQRLMRLEEDTSADVTEAASRQVSESVALAVSLCDALALIGDPEAITGLKEVLQLKHRRLRVEAAAGLAALDDADGRKSLIEWAADPVVRLFALRYADELELLDEVDPQYRTDVARGEAELVMWLSGPSVFGIPPTEVELIDQRQQYWPGYDDPVECFLFRFSYQFSSGRYDNIGIAGPATFALTADATSLPPDDLYCLFAGWQAEHEDIVQWDATAVEGRRQATVERLRQQLVGQGFEQVQPEILGSFFEYQVLVARAHRDQRAGIAVIDDQHVEWRPHATTPRPLGANEWYSLYKGRRLLQMFNTV